MRHLLTFSDIQGDPPTLVQAGQCWGGLEPDPAGGEQSERIRSAIRTKIPVRWEAWMKPAQIVTYGDRLYVVESIANRREIGADAELWAYEYQGEPATISATGFPTVTGVLVKLWREVFPFAGTTDGVPTAFERRADFLRFQIPYLPSYGASLTVSGVTYKVDSVLAGSEFLGEATIAISR